MATKEELASAKRDVQIKELERKTKLAAWNEYVSFATVKAAGVVAVICGGLDVVNPSLIPHIPHPDKVLGGGLALLAGKSFLTIFSRKTSGAG